MHVPMHFDALAAACMADELRRLLCPGRIQATLLADDDSLGLEVYVHGARRQLLLCAAPQAPRLHLVDHKLRRGVETETPLLLLARKYLRDALLTDVSRPLPYERILHFHCAHKEHGPTTLVVELIGRQANLILLRPDGRILERLHRQARSAPYAPANGETMPGMRTLLPGRLYTPPPPQDKLPPLDDGRPDYYERLAAVLDRAQPLAKTLVEGIAGMSPQAAREAAWRAAGDPHAPATAATVLAVAAALQELWAAAQGRTPWAPGILQEGERVVGFVPYAARGPGRFVPTGTLSEAVAAYFETVAAYFAAAEAQGQAPTQPPGPVQAGAAAPAAADPYAQARANVAALLRRARQGVERRLAGLAADEPAPDAAQRLRAEAEWLLALHTEIAPGQQALEVPLDDGVLRIILDPSVPPVEQAQRLFRRAAKLERAASFIPQRRAELQADLALLDQLALDLQRAANQPEIAAVGRVLADAGLLAHPRGSSGGAGPGAGKSMRGSAHPASGGLLRVRSAQGLEIVAGRNARQNERVTFEEAHPEDLWLHARAVPGSHVIIRTAGQVPDGETIRTAAQLAAYHSGARGDRAVAVVVTRKRFVQRAPGGKLGQVLVRQEEQVLTVPGELPPGFQAA